MQDEPLLIDNGGMNNQRSSEQAFDLAGFLPYKLSVLARLTQSLLASALVEAGITIAQWRVYLCLAKQGPSHLNGIADFTMLPQSSLSRSIAQMAERGLVHSVRNDDDRRWARIELTAPGRRQFEKLTIAIQAKCDAAFAMDASEDARFVATLDELIARLANRLGEPAPVALAGAATDTAPRKRKTAAAAAIDRGRRPAPVDAAKRARR